MDILDDMGVSKLSAKRFFFKVNYSFKCYSAAQHCVHPSVVGDISTHPNCFISYGILMPSVFKQPH